MPPLSMASTRRAQPMEIYQDPTFEHHQNDHMVEAMLLEALNPVHDINAKHNLILEPSTHAPSAESPTKSDRRSSSPAGPLRSRSLNSVALPPPRQPDFATDSLQKNASYFQPCAAGVAIQAMPHPFIPPPYAAGRPIGKENTLSSSSFDPASTPYHTNNGHYDYKASNKRTFVESTPTAPHRDRMNNKKLKTEESGRQDAVSLPDPADMPLIEDDGTKPPHSYATLIGMAILRAPNRRLTLAQIYKWISDKYSYFRPSDSGWQNSIRHNLSLNKSFVKQERPKDDPGKGNYWAIVPGSERQFLIKDKQVRKTIPGDNATFVQATQHDFSTITRPASTPAIGHFVLGPPSSNKRYDSKVVDSSKFPDDNLSSDGTLPASDPAMQDDEHQASLSMPPPASRNIRSSPPPEDIGSSPPPMILDAGRSGTPPPLHHYQSEGRKRKEAAVNDSGYFSSIESSATRGPGYSHMIPTSEADNDRPRVVKRGRAEEEIARIRSSSYDSPSKDQAHRRKPSVHFGTSSPKRPDSSSGLPPLTPHVVFKRPAPRLASISPNTNLRNHRARMRRLLGDSPSKNMTPLRENDNAWTPHFSLVETENLFSPEKSSNNTPWRDSLFANSLEALGYGNHDDLTARGSPEKRRPRMERAVTSTGALAEITGSRINVNGHGDQENSFNFAFSPFKMTPDAVLPRNGSRIKRSMTSTPHLNVSNAYNAPEWLDLDLDSIFGSATKNQVPVTQALDNSNNHNHNFSQMSSAQSQGPFFGFEPRSDASEEGVDILQEFGKIGAQMSAQRYVPSDGGSASKKSQGLTRPGLGRSVTSRF